MSSNDPQRRCLGIGTRSTNLKKSYITLPHIQPKIERLLYGGLSRQYEESLTQFRRGHELGSKQAGWRPPPKRWMEETEKKVTLIPTLKKVVAGGEKPTDPKVIVELAELALDRKCYACSAELFAAFIQLDPKSANLFSGGQNGFKTNNHQLGTKKYVAACAAVQSSCGRGEDATKLNEVERLKWRRQAMSWLTAELTEFSQYFGSAPPEAIGHWQLDPDLAPVRDEAELQKLPASEQAEWRKLWADVDALKYRFERERNPRLAPPPRPKQL